MTRPYKRRRSFWDYKPVKHPLGRKLGYNDCLIETYDEDLEIIREQLKKDPTKVWTILDCDEVVAGCHFVNRLGYFITEHSWEDERIYYAKV